MSGVDWQAEMLRLRAERDAALAERERALEGWARGQERFERMEKERDAALRANEEHPYFAALQESRRRAEQAEEERDAALAALRRAKHIAENIADPYNERRDRLHAWGGEIVALADDALRAVRETPQP